MRLKRKSKGDIIFDCCNTFFVCLVIAICLFPFLNVIATSLSSPNMVLTNKVTIFPLEPTLLAYRKVLDEPNIFISYRNSIVYTVVYVVASLFVTTLAAYPLSKRRLTGRRGILFFITFTTIFHGGMIPTYLVVRGAGLLDSMWALILPYCITVYNTMLLRTYFEGLPLELEEAAKIDGLGDVGIMTKIFVPLAMPMYATLFLMLTVSQWNSFFPPLLYLGNKSQYPLQILLREMILSANSDMNYRSLVEAYGQVPAEQAVKSATIIVVCLPILLLFPFVQKFFVKGMTVGSVKG